MSIAGFREQNHPLQVASRGAVDQVDDRGTPQDFYDATSERFGGFTLDVAAAAHNAKCEDYLTRDDDGLVQRWRGRVWCNPPYSNAGAWIRKAWLEWNHWPRDPDLIVMLLPANRAEQGWWQESIEPFRDRPGSPLRVEFLPGRLRFTFPDGVEAPKHNRPLFGCCLLIWSAPDARPETAPPVPTREPNLTTTEGEPSCE